MYQNPKRAKKLYREVVPKAVDEYLEFIEKGKTQNELQKLMNPVWHVHNGKIPNEKEKVALNALVQALDNCNDKMKPEDIQTNIYTVGKENGYKENLREWFKLIYEVVFGDENGPRMGFFISFFGVKETKELIENKLSNV